MPRLTRRLGAEYGPASRYWAGGGPEWDVVAEALDGSALLVGEVKWFETASAARAVERAAHELLAKGVPPVRRSAGAELRHVLFVPRRPKGALNVPASMLVLDAKDVLSVLR